MTIISITQAASRRNALRLALGGAAVVALPSSPSLATLQVSDSDKKLRWLGDQLESDYAEFWRAAEAFHAFAESGRGKTLKAMYRFADTPPSPEFERKHALWLAKEGRWAHVEARCWEISREPVTTLAGLAVKARAVELSATGCAAARCAMTGLPCNEAEIGWWSVGRMLSFVGDVRRVGEML